jgi:AcrR family transcriptional regulator
MMMVRTNKDPVERRKEILDSAQHFIYTKGYEQMTIQDILDDLDISKGAFYHYFDSKPALLEAIINRMQDDAELVYLPIVQDPHLSGLEKFQLFFDRVSSWKNARKEFFMPLVQVWYADENALVRQKLTSAVIRRILPLFSQIICQGNQEGVFSTAYPDQVGDVIFHLLYSMSDSYAEIFLADISPETSLERMVSMVTVYSDAMERILGAPRGSIKLIDIETMKEWVNYLNTVQVGKERQS